jgi:hypothetical protein
MQLHKPKQHQQEAVQYIGPPMRIIDDELAERFNLRSNVITIEPSKNLNKDIFVPYKDSHISDSDSFIPDRSDDFRTDTEDEEELPTKKVEPKKQEPKKQPKKQPKK